MRPLHKLALAASFLTLTAFTAPAAVVLHVDAASETMYFTGSASGFASLSLNFYSGSSPTFTSGSTISFDTTHLSFTNTLAYTGTLGLSSTNEIAGGMIGTTIGPSTMTGTGLAFSYASLDTVTKSRIEEIAAGGGMLSFSGNSMPAIELTAVPEPSTVLFTLAGAAGLALFGRRLRKQAA